MNDIMGILFTGRDTAIKVHRWISPFYSFNQAFKNRAGDIGFPVNTICEVYGNKGIGKSTFAYSMAGRLAKDLQTNIDLADIERHLDQDYMESVLRGSGYEGEVYVALGDSDALMLEDMTDKFAEDKYRVGILDSIGAVSPIAEEEGKLSDANMGRRAFLMSNFSRRVTKVCRRDLPSVIFATNHVHQNIGSRGSTSSGGVTVKYLCSTRIRLSIKETFDDGSYWLAGKVDNNTFGYSHRTFYVFNLAGYGLHPGLSALRDCVLLGLAKEGRTIKIGDKSFGFMKHIIENANDPELFQPFHQLLKEHQGVEVITQESEEE